MKTRAKRGLAASFVVTVSAVAPPLAALGTAGCKKQPLEQPEPEDPRANVASVWRNGDRCVFSVPMRCPKGATCNPPPPTEIDCPPSHRDAGESDPSPARPPGKEGWLRVKPHLYVSQYGCSYSPEYFCEAPPRPLHCDDRSQALTLRCGRVLADGGVVDAGAITDAGAVPQRWRVEAFTYKDAVGVCHAVDAFECPAGECVQHLAGAKTVPCP